MTTGYSETTATEIEDIFAAVVDKIAFDGKDLVLIEPYEGPRPRVAYASIHLTGALPQEHEIKEYSLRNGDDFREKLKGTSWCRVVVRFFGKDAFAAATRTQGAFLAQARLFDLLPKIGLGEIGEAQDAPQPYQGKIENQAFFTVSFYANLSSEHDASFISRVVGTIAADGGNAPFAAEANQ